jgi:hypothetical protein
MESADKLFERAKRLKPEELSELVARLDEYLSAPAEESTKSARSYVRSLALSGTGDTDQTDVSSHKGRHLAEVYASRREG